MFKDKYRIVTSESGEFVVQRRFWFWPFYSDLTSSFISIKDAELYAEKIIKHDKFKREVVRKY